MAIYFFISDERFSGVPGQSDFLAEGVVAEVEGVEGDGVQPGDIDFAVLTKDRFLRLRVHDLADDGEGVLGVDDFLEFAFHDERELLDDRSIDELALCLMQAGLLELVLDLVAGVDADIVCRDDVGGVRDADGERLRLQDVLGGLMGFADEQRCRSSCPRQHS